MNKRELKRIFYNVQKAFEPALVFGFGFVFVFAILTVINLNAKPNYFAVNTNANVLGVSQSIEDLKVPVVRAFQGSHTFINSEILKTEVENSDYIYKLAILPREKGAYSKPALEINNIYNEAITVSFSNADILTSKTEYGILYEKTNYVLKASNGELYPHSLTINPGEKLDAYIYISNKEKVNFTEIINIKVRIEIPEGAIKLAEIEGVFQSETATEQELN